MDATTRIICIGSPHGDDQAGWLVAKRLARKADLPFAVITVSNPLDMLDHLEGCRRLVIVDAARGAQIASPVTRLIWPDERIAEQESCSTHGLGVVYALKMAENMRRLPETVILYAIHSPQTNASQSPGDACLAGVAQAEKRILAEVARSTEDAPCTSDR